VIGEYADSGAELKAYGWKPGSTWGTDPLFMKIGNSYYFYHNDHLGTPQKMTAVNGSVVWTAKYTSFGEADIEDGSILENHLRFAGQYYDGETGLHYNYHRYYKISIGKYLTSDPIGLKGGINTYGYVINNPINLVDPKGLAYFAYRPLSGFLKIFGVVKSEIDDRNNTVIGHEQLFFEDGKPISNIGYFDDGTLKEESDVSKYRPSHDLGYDDALMREAVKNVELKKYQLLPELGTGYKNNCQDWAEDVRQEYNRLKKRNENY
jgi:RHS repeat-associated protein